MTAEAVWRTQFDQVCAQIENAGAIIEFDDGFRAVDPDLIPGALLTVYRRVCEVGYAKGWL